MTYQSWLDELELYSTRYERLCATFAHLDKPDWDQLLLWLSAAYEVGYREGKEDNGVPF